MSAKKSHYNIQDVNYIFDIMAEKLDAIADIIPLELEEVTESRTLYARLELLKELLRNFAEEARSNAREYQTEAA